MDQKEIQLQEEQSPQNNVSAQEIQTTQSNDIKNAKPVKVIIDENRPRYGRMKVLFQKGPFLITLGPDYGCFLGGFLFFCALAYLLCSTVKSVFKDNQKFILVSYLLGLLQCGSYLLVALSNPSIALRENNPIKLSQITQQNQHRTCKKCGAQARRKTYHCRECDVCINGYDHHCPWTSKCIGQGNLYRFYIFVTITPVYILAFMGIMMFSLIIIAGQANQNLRKAS